MAEAKKCIRALALYCLLISLSIIPGTDIIPRSFPTDSICDLYLLFLSVCLSLHYYLRAAGRRELRTSVQSLSVMILLMFLLRCAKYSVFGNRATSGRYTWYLYYLPMLSIPLLLFFISLYIYSEDRQRVLRRWGWTAVLTAVLVAAVLTNDLHLQVFRFQADFADWDSCYSYGPLYYLLTAWEYLLYTAAVVVLVAKHPVSKIKRWSWLILVPFITGLVLILCSLTGRMPKINNLNILEFPESYCFMAAGVVECCMQLGLVPVNENYKALFRISGLPVQITDRNGTPVYQSASAAEPSPEFLTAADGTRIAEHTLLHRLELPNGYGFWQEDVTELDRLNEALQDANERLSEETELTRLQNELRARQEAIEQRTRVYDEIARHTQRQSTAISALAKQAIAAECPAEKDQYRKQLALLGAYIKRYANLTLLASDCEFIPAGELGLSLAELLRYLNLYGIPGEIINTASGTLPAKTALAVLDAFETLLEENLSELRGVLVNLSGENPVVCRLVPENITASRLQAVLEKLAGIPAALEEEDGTCYLRLTLAGGGGEG